MTRRRYFVPEVIQSSAMDCGPASLKAMLEGYGTHVSYGRLREACQTDVDGTSIDTMEEVAVQLGLVAEQVMIPADHLLVPEAHALPALVVVRLPNGVTHFVVAWRRHGRLIEVMDPGIGRRWMLASSFLSDLYIHRMPVPADAWREWAQSEESTDSIRHRLEELGVSRRTVSGLLSDALSDPGWQPIAALDATTRMVGAIVRAGGLDPGRQAARVLRVVFQQACENADEATSEAIPEAYWSVRPAPPDDEGNAQLMLTGAVLVRVLGKKPGWLPLTATTAFDRGAATRGRLEDGAPAGEKEVGPAGGEGPGAPDQKEAGPTGEEGAEPAGRLSPDLVAALSEKPQRPGRDLLHLLRADGLLTPALLLMTLLLSSLGVMTEAVLFRGFMDIGRDLGLSVQRLVALVALITLMVAMLLLDWPAREALLRMGRHLETRLRVAFLAKLPLLGDRYFRSRLASDMAERSHSVRNLRHLPMLGGQFVRACFDLALTVAGIAILAPDSAHIVLLAAALVVIVPLSLQPALTERDLRVRSHLGALARFYLDALMGLVPIRCHGAEPSVRREHEALVVEWSRAGLSLQRLAVLAESLQALAGFGLAAWLLANHLSGPGHAGTALLIIYWALNLPVYGQEVAVAARQYPSLRNVTLRLMEPLGAPEESIGTLADVGELDPELRSEGILAASGSTAEGIPPRSGRKPPPRHPSANVAIRFDDTTVRAAGHTILDGIRLDVRAGSQVAIVGASGAGKSSLVGVLLGWYRPASGRVLVDGQLLDGPGVAWLRRHTAWVDPSVQLWNRSFVQNLLYGAPPEAQDNLSSAINAANLRPMLEHLPDGLQTALGESGALVSGGEGQRVRLGRSMLRPGVRLVILDEPFRGLDRQQRRELLARARRWWTGATLLCITHDVGETLGFDRVVVIEKGHIAEQGRPEDLLADESSIFRRLLEAEKQVREQLWSGDQWRHLWLEKGRLARGGEEDHLARGGEEGHLARGGEEDHLASGGEEGR